MYIHMYRTLYGLMCQREHDDVLHILYVSVWHKGYYSTCEHLQMCICAMLLYNYTLESYS